MTQRNHDDTSPPWSPEETVLVCGVCGAILPDRFEAPGQVDEAADAHVEAEHPERPEVIVLPAPIDLARRKTDELVKIAAIAQSRIDGEDLAASEIPEDHVLMAEDNDQGPGIQDP